MKIKEINRTPNYTMVRVTSSDDDVLSTGRASSRYLDEAYEAEQWCSQTGCGKRVNLWNFAFKTEPEFTWFKLRWIK